MEEAESGFGIARFQKAEGDVLAGALAMRLKIEKEDREAIIMEHPRAAQHLQPVRPDPVH